MYLWNRQFYIDTGRWAEGVAALMAATEIINEKSEYHSDVWMPASVGPPNVLGISARLERYAPFAEERAAMLSEPDILASIAAAGPCITSVQDFLTRIVHTAGERGDVPVVCSMVNWQAHPADLKKALVFAIELADYQHSVGGQTVVVGSSVWGQPNGITMIGNFDSLADFESASDAIQAEGSFLDRLEAGAVGMAETIQTWVMRRAT